MVCPYNEFDAFVKVVERELAKVVGARMATNLILCPGHCKDLQLAFSRNKDPVDEAKLILKDEGL